jgi:hypothetical protein
MTLAVHARPSELVLKSSTERLDIKIVDAEGVAVDATQLELTIYDMNSTEVYADDFFNPPTPPGVTRIVKTGTGTYYFPLGDQSVIANTETDSVRRLLAVWAAVGPVGSEAANVVQNVRVVSARTMALAGDLRLLIDKTVKFVDDNPSDPCYLGYTDGMLVQFLEHGVQIWNEYEPYPTFSTVDDFPLLYEHGLLEAALLAGVASQELFAIDTDIPNYSAQGAAFVIQHQPQLAGVLTRLGQRLDKLIPIAKLKLIQTGSIHIQMGPNYRLNTLIQSAPPGAIFRNFFVSGGL